MAFRDQSDEALVQRVRSGEREVFGVLVDRYKRGIANFIGATVRNSSETADLSQETFLRAYAHLHTFNPQLGWFPTWIYQIARNVIRTYLAKSQRAPQLQETLAGADARDGACRSLTPSGSRRRAAAPRSRARAARRVGRASGPHANGVGPALFRQHGVSDDREHARALTGKNATTLHRGKIALTKKMRERERSPLRRTGRGAGEGRPRMRCSSCEPLLDDSPRSVAEPPADARRHASSAVCAPLSATHSWKSLRVVDALLVDRAVARARRFGFYCGRRLGHGGHAAAPQPAE